VNARATQHRVVLDRGADDSVARAIVNILEDTSGERDQLELTHKAMLNILEDFAVATDELMRANKELTYLDELKSEFVAMASHELRTPLTSITGFSSTMLNNWTEIPDESKLEFVGIIDEQAQRLARLVQSLLTVSRIESGVVETDAERFGVCEAIHQTISHIDAPYIEVNCDPELSLVADPDHFQQIVMNYLANAIAYGAPPIRVEVRQARGFVTVRVVDHGPGVPSAFVPKLFDRFAQADTDPSRSAVDGRGKGTGLGLSIVRALARLHGGQASYERNEPTGSVFLVRFPDLARGL